MTVAATIQGTDFLPLMHTHRFVFIFFCKDPNGKLYNIEDFGSKTDLCRKYGIRNMNFAEWDTRQFKGRDCEISVRWLRRNRMKRIAGKNDPYSHTHFLQARRNQ